MGDRLGIYLDHKQEGRWLCTTLCHLLQDLDIIYMPSGMIIRVLEGTDVT